MRVTILTLAVSLALAGTAARAADSKGELLFHIGGCTNCHTAKDGALLAGGDPIATPFGNFIAPNITPDPETGIGRWSLEDFVRAMREGRDPAGRPLYPAFPYTSYTRMSDEDLAALKTYLDSVPAVRQEARPHELRFPFNLRWGLYLWQWLFFTPERFAPDPVRDAVWDRGAYLVLGPGHCGECHTPRTFYGVLDWSRPFAGGQIGKERVPDITPAKTHGLGEWSSSDIATLLKLGMTPDGDFVGSDMAKIVNNGTGKLPQPDLDAIVAFLQSLPAS